VDCGEKVSRGFVVASGDGAILLELAEEILDEMSRFIGVLVEIALDFAVAFGWNNERLSAGEQRLDDTFVSIEGFVSQQDIGCHLRQQRISARQIVSLTRRQQKPQRIAKGIDQRVNLGAQPAFAAPDRFVFARFFWAPALC
jgi:hypothetical protein